MTIENFNTLSKEKALNSMIRCCGAVYWARSMVGRRPYYTLEALLTYADACWNECTEADALEAFAHHPRIGDTGSLEKKFSSTAEWARNEQKKVEQANQKTILALATANKEYEKKFGYIFIVFASGKSANEMLSILQDRLKNDPDKELKIARAEQHKITKMRLKKLLT